MLEEVIRLVNLVTFVVHQLMYLAVQHITVES